MFVKWLLNGIFVAPCDFWLQELGIWVIHNVMEGSFSNCKSFYNVNGLVEELRALVSEAGVVVDGADDFLFLAHDDSHSVEDLIEESVANSYCSVCDVDYLEDLFILLLDHVPILVEDPGLQTLDKLNLEVSQLLLLGVLLDKHLSQVVELAHCPQSLLS